MDENNSPTKEIEETIEKSSDDENICEVEKILKKRRRRGKTEYLIKWKDQDEQSWVDSDDILDEALIEDFENSKMVTPQKPRKERKRKKSTESTSSRSSHSSKSSSELNTSVKKTPKKSPKKIVNSFFFFDHQGS
jgi:hypothetical protein